MRLKIIQRTGLAIMTGCLMAIVTSCGGGNASQPAPASEKSEEHHVMGTFNEVPADALSGGWIRNGGKGTMTLKSDGSVELSTIPKLSYTGWRQVLANVVELKCADGSTDSAFIETYQHPMTMTITKRNLSFTHDRP